MHTLRQWWAIVLERRKASRRSAAVHDANRWATHVEPSEFIDAELPDVSRPRVREWLRELETKPRVIRQRHWTVDTPGVPARSLNRKTLVNVLTLFRCVMQEALDDGLIDQNPADGLRVVVPPTTHVPWTFLDVAEQARLLSAIEEPERWMVAFAIYTGLRLGELFALLLGDLHHDDPARPHVVVRFGAPNLPPKNGRIRTVPLNPLAIDAANRWLAALPTYAPVNPHALVFPGPQGGRRARPPELWSTWVRRARLGRGLRWHDLRHTHLSALVSGMWGPAVRLEDAKEFAGHSDIKMTQRYAHLAHGRLDELAATIGTPPAAVLPRQVRARLNEPSTGNHERAGTSGAQVLQPKSAERFETARAPGVVFESLRRNPQNDEQLSLPLWPARDNPKPEVLEARAFLVSLDDELTLALAQFARSIVRTGPGTSQSPGLAKASPVDERDGKARGAPG